MSEPKRRFHLERSRIDAHGSVSRGKAAEVPPDTVGLSAGIRPSTLWRKLKKMGE